MRKSILVLLSFVFLFFFALLSKYEDRALIRSLDFTVTVKMQDFVAKFCMSRCDSTLEDIGFLGGPIFSSVAVLFLAYYHFLKAKGRKKLLSLSIPILLALLTVIEIYGKTIVRHPAPPFFFLKNPSTTFPTYYIWQEFSYPSGHAARAVFLGILFYSYFIIHDSQFKRKNIKTRIAIGIFIYVIVVSLSRIYLGHHWLSDVVGGWWLGGGLGVLTWAVVAPYNKKAMST